MLDREQLEALRQDIYRMTELDNAHLGEIRSQVRALRDRVKPIRPRNATAVALMATDGGENYIRFDPYLIVPVRIVDSYGKPHYVGAVSPYTSIAQLNEFHFQHQTPLGVLMRDLGVDGLWNLSRFIPHPDTPPQEIRRRWVRDYRDLMEWAVLYTYVMYQSFATDTVLVRDGFLRSLIFYPALFKQMWACIRARVDELRQRERRRVFLVGIAKQSRILDRYHLVMFLEGVLVRPDACYLPVPRFMEEQVYRWTQYGRTPESESETETGEAHYEVIGKLHFAKFGDRPYDPIYPVDVWVYHEERNEVDEVFSYLLADAQAGFPQPFYPLCLQKAHEQANLSGFEGEMLQELVVEAIRDAVCAGEPSTARELSNLEVFRLLSKAKRGGGYEQR
jgi:hypothetical protein